LTSASISLTFFSSAAIRSSVAADNEGSIMVNQLLLLITFAFKIFDLCTWLRHTLTDAYLYWCGTLRINNNNDRLIRIKGLWCRGSGEPRAGADLQSKSSTLTPQICEQEKNPQGFLDFGGVQKNPDDEKIS